MKSKEEIRDRLKTHLRLEKQKWELYYDAFPKREMYAIQAQSHADRADTLRWVLEEDNE